MSGTTPVSPALTELDPRKISGPVDGGPTSPWSPRHLEAIKANDFFIDGLAQIISVDATGVTARRVFYDSGVKDVLVVPATTAPAGSDAFANAPEILLGQSSDPTDNTTFTVETGEPDASGYGGLAQTAWWKFTPTENIQCAVDTEQTVNTGTGTDTKVAVYTGGPTLDTLTAVGFDDDGGPNSTSKFSFAATAGTTYYVQVSPYSTGNMQYVLRVSIDLGNAIAPSGPTLARFGTDQAAFLTEQSNYVEATAMSEAGPAITRAGNMPTQPWATNLTTSDYNDTTMPGPWYAAEHGAVLMVSATQGYLLGYIEGSTLYSPYLVPFTMTSETEFNPGTALFTQTAIKIQVPETQAIIWLGFPYSGTTFVATENEILDSVSGFIKYWPKIAAFGFDGHLVAESDYLVPSSSDTGTGYSQYGWVTVAQDPSNPGSFLVAAKEVTDYTSTVGHEHGPDGKVTLRWATFNGSAWTLGPKTTVASTTNLQPPYPNRVFVLSDGRIFLDYVVGTGLTSNGAMIWVRHLQILDANFTVLQEWTIGDNVDPAVGNYYFIQNYEDSVVTENFAIVYYNYWNDTLNDADQRYLLLQHSETKVPVTVGAHHGNKIVRYTAQALTDPASASAVLGAGAPTLVTSTSTQAAIVGTGSVWADTDDTTYVTLANSATGGDEADAQLAPLTGVTDTDVTAVELHIRVAAGDANGGTIDFQVALSATSGGTSVGIFGPANPAWVSVPRDGLTYDLVVPLEDPATSGTPLTQTVDALINGAYLRVESDVSDTASPWSINVYEASVQATYNTTVPQPNVLTIKGPGMPGQGDYQTHQGMFALNQQTQTISAWLQSASPERNVWVRPYARFFTSDGGTVTEIGEEPLASAIALTPQPQYTETYLYAPGRADATHWVLDLRMFADAGLTTPLPAGTHVYFDCFMVPDNGMDMQALEQPYLDGDQTGAMWEGDTENSTSVYGTKPISPFRKVFLGDALALPAPPN